MSLVLLLACLISLVMGAFDDLILIPASPKDTNAAKEPSTPTREQIVNNETPSKPKPVGGVVPPVQNLVPGIRNGLDELPTFSLGAPLVRSTSPLMSMPTGYSNPAKMEPVAENNDGKMDKSSIIGIAVGVSLGSLILFGLLFFCCWKAPKKTVKVGYKSLGGKEKGSSATLTQVVVSGGPASKGQTGQKMIQGRPGPPPRNPLPAMSRSKPDLPRGFAARSQIPDAKAIRDEQRSQKTLSIPAMKAHPSLSTMIHHDPAIEPQVTFVKEGTTGGDRVKRVMENMRKNRALQARLPASEHSDMKPLLVKESQETVSERAGIVKKETETRTLGYSPRVAPAGQEIPSEYVNDRVREIFAKTKKTVRIQEEVDVKEGKDEVVRPNVPERRLSAEKTAIVPRDETLANGSASSKSLCTFPPLEGMENDLKSVNAKKSTGKTMASNEDDDDASTDIASNLYERPAVTKKASQRPTSSNVNVGTSGKRNLLLDHQPDRVQRHLEALEVKYKDILSVQ